MFQKIIELKTQASKNRNCEISRYSTQFLVWSLVKGMKIVTIKSRIAPLFHPIKICFKVVPIVKAWSPLGDLIQNHSFLIFPYTS